METIKNVLKTFVNSSSHRRSARNKGSALGSSLILVSIDPPDAVLRLIFTGRKNYAMNSSVYEGDYGCGLFGNTWWTFLVDIRILENGDFRGIRLPEKKSPG